MQHRFASAVMTPLTADWAMQPIAPDGRPMTEVAGEFVKPNDRLTAFERIEIYNKMYWFRLIDIMYEDYPGVAAILGQKRFNHFCERYLNKYPSQSGLLRNLGKSIVRFIDEQPSLTSPQTDMASDMALFEWSQVESFDAEARPPLSADDLLGKDPSAMRLVLQPSIKLLDLRFAVDRLFLAVKKQGLRNEASNAAEGLKPNNARRRSAKKVRTLLAIHRHNNSVFIKVLEPQAFAILQSLQSGRTIAEAIESATPESIDAGTWVGQVQEWFKIWMSMGWFCREGKPPKTPKSR